MLFRRGLCTPLRLRVGMQQFSNRLFYGMLHCATIRASPYLSTASHAAFAQSCCTAHLDSRRAYRVFRCSDIRTEHCTY